MKTTYVMAPSKVSLYAYNSLGDAVFIEPDVSKKPTLEITVEEDIIYKRIPIPEIKRQAIKRRDNYTCQICGKYMPDEIGLHIDHKIPVSRGGNNAFSNLQVLCDKCNGHKGTKILDFDF